MIERQQSRPHEGYVLIAAALLGNNGDDLSRCGALCVRNGRGDPFGVFGADEVHCSHPPVCCSVVIATSHLKLRRRRSRHRRRTNHRHRCRRPTSRHPNFPTRRESR